MHEPSDGDRRGGRAPAAAHPPRPRRSPHDARSPLANTRSNRPDATASRTPAPRRPGSTPSGHSRPSACARCSSPDWWETARPQEIADMWQEASTWRDPDHPAAATPTIFDQAAHRIRQEVRDRSGLDPTQIVTLAAVQELEHEHQAALAEQPAQPAELGADAARRPAARVRRSAAARAAPRASRRRRRSRARDRGTNARRPRPSPGGGRGGTNAPHDLSGAAPRRRRSLSARARTPSVSAAHRHRWAAPSLGVFANREG